MTDSGRIEESWKRVLDANMKYYEAMGAITRDYLSAVGNVWREALPPLTLRLPGSAPPARESPAASAGAAPSSSPALVLEGAEGQEVRAAFAVHNDLGREVSAPVMVSSLHDESGREVQLPLRLVPGIVTLAPGAKGVVEVRVGIDASLPQDVGHYGTITVPDLTTSRIAFVVRRVAHVTAAAPDALKPSKATARRKAKKATRRR